MALQKVVRNMLSTGVSDSSDATAITINSSEQVGIGVTDPDQALEIGAGGKLKLSRADNARSMLLFTDNSNCTIQSDTDPLLLQSANIMTFNTNGANEAMRIDTNGNISLGGGANASNFSNYVTLDLRDSTGGIIDFSEASAGVHSRIQAVVNNSLNILNRQNYPLYLGTNDTTRLTITGAGNVGIGDTSPTRELSLKKTTDHSIMAITTGTSTLAGIVIGDTGADDQGGIIYNNSGDYLYFRTGGAERARILNGGGLTFNGDTAAANALDDYEEGTWTPTDSSGASLTFAASGGRYQKVGNTVHVVFRVQYPSTSSGANGRIGGLPYTSVSSSAGSLDIAGGATTALAQNFNSGYSAYIEQNAQTMYLFKTDTSQATIATNATLSGQNIYMYGHYTI